MIFPSCPNKQKKSPHKKKKRKINFVYNLPSTENISMTKLLNSEADSSLRVGVANISFLVWQWGSGRKKSGTKRHWATRHCKVCQKAEVYAWWDYKLCSLYTEDSLANNTWQFYFWNNVFFRSLRDIEQPLVVLCIFPCPSDVTKPPAALSYWQITWFIRRQRAAHMQRINWLFVSLLKNHLK